MTVGMLVSLIFEEPFLLVLLVENHPLIEPKKLFEKAANWFRYAGQSSSGALVE